MYSRTSQAKLRSNKHLSFETATEDLYIWKDAFVPPLQRQLKVHHPFCLLTGFQHFESKRWPAVVLFVFLQSSRNRTRSPIAVTKSCSIFSLLVDWTIKETIISPWNTAASVSRLSCIKMSSIFSHSTKSNTTNVFWESGDDNNEPSCNNVRSLMIMSLVSF